jgi:uncharacterized protein (TIGR03435 family)
MRSFQVVNAPDWLSAERYDISATAGENVTLGSIGDPGAPVIQMLRSLLADRFRLTVHKESRERCGSPPSCWQERTGGLDRN